MPDGSLRSPRPEPLRANTGENERSKSETQLRKGPIYLRTGWEEGEGEEKMADRPVLRLLFVSIQALLV